MTDNEYKMPFKLQLKNLRSTARRQIAFYRALHQDHRTPKFAKIIFWLAISYLLLPFDIIPDFIPIVGQIDDVVIVPLLLFLALKMVPHEVLEEHKSQNFGL